MASTGIINQQMIDPNDPTAIPGASSPVVTPATGIIAKAQTAPDSTVANMPAMQSTTAQPATTQAPATPTDYSSQIQSLYQKDFGRQADQAGLDYWNGAMKNQGVSLDQTEAFMKSSDEYKALHPPAASTGAYTPAQLGTPTQWNVTPNQTVQGQLTSMIDPNSPYYQQWATAGAQDAAARGFTGNSSIRSTGIMNSVMANATPIATADAATQAKAAGYNSDMQNQFAVANQNATNQMLGATLSAGTTKYTAGLSAETQKAVAQLSATSQQTISQAHDANSTLIQNNQAASQAYNSYVAAIAQIDQNTTMDEAAKQRAIIQQNQTFNSAMAGIKAASPGATDLYNPNDPISISAKAQAVEAAKANAAGAGNAAAQAVGGVDVSDQLQGLGG